MGRIYEERGSPPNFRWFWSIFGILAKPPGVRTDGRAPTLEEAKADFEASWRKWLAWAKPSETACVLGTGEPLGCTPPIDSHSPPVSVFPTLGKGAGIVPATSVCRG